ncbi:Protein of unknown function [Cotesia congregata]|uniref:Uncharacterized protein n=1 Tax=Cotesia congregata TaxID=51543 RepID=A0A8J2HDE7_COTCN|nr:Protein of unknown function [Cotesia congregata]
MCISSENKALCRQCLKLVLGLKSCVVETNVVVVESLVVRHLRCKREDDMKGLESDCKSTWVVAQRKLRYLAVQVALEAN